MSDKLKSCPWCGHPGALNFSNRVFCPNTRCPNHDNPVDYSIETWQSRPVEDVLTTRCNELLDALQEAVLYAEMPVKSFERIIALIARERGK